VQCTEIWKEVLTHFVSPFSSQLGPVGAGHPKPRVFSYNVVFEPGATQDDVLQFSGIKRLIEMAVEGFSTTAFCYGQTGSGKTHTLTGPPGLVSSRMKLEYRRSIPFARHVA
jgi:hypothetical protein